MPDLDDPATPPPAFVITPIEEGLPPRIAGVAIEGEADLAAAGEFRRCVEAAIDRKADALLVDASELRFIDSSMLKELLRARSDVGKVVLCGLEGAPGRLLDLTRTRDLFTHARDRDEGVALAAGG